MDQQEQSPIEDGSDNSLETPDKVVEVSSSPANTADQSSSNSTSPGSSSEGFSGSTPSQPPTNPQLPHHKLKEKFHMINIYLLGFIFVCLLGAAIVFVVFYKSQKSTISSSSAPQSLSQNQLEQLASSSQTIGSSSQVLNIGANSIFNGQVLVQKDLDVAGNLKIGGSLNLPGISVAGGAKFAQIQTNKLNVSGDTTLSGPLVSSNSIDISGASSFSGPVTIGNLTVQNLTLGSQLTISSHIKTGGSIPSRSTGSAVGTGGTSSVSGNDTSGTVNINAGSSPSTGCFVTVNFTKPYSSTPHVIITPVGSYAGSLQYYVNRTSSSFSICTDSAAASGSSFAFDYIVFD